ncbi:50S ribosomal protein L10 [Candidatus Micrarchaeota archaeon]|nr:50S ribosomal protein L10 [Candidatus Micrarchaeota archaeon]
MPSKQQKIDSVKNISEDLKKFKTVAIASNASLPAKSYNQIKKKASGKAKIDFARHTLLLRALDSKPEYADLKKYLGNGSVLLLSDLDAFKLYKLFKQSKIQAAAKAGQIAPNDIVIPAGETNLPPGPVLTDLKNAKIKAKIQGPKVVITDDAVVAKKGEVITPQVANILSKLGVKPMEIGLEVKAVFDNGMLYEGSVLDIDDEAVKNNLALAYQQALNLCVFAGIVNKDSVVPMIQKASREANALQSLVKEPASN